MASEGHERNAKNYRLAVNHLERYLGTTRVMFTHLSSSVLTRWINSLSLTNRAKGNIPVSIIVDELPTLYFHKIDRFIGTARSNKVAVILGSQEFPQLEADYGKVGMQKIITT